MGNSDVKLTSLACDWRKLGLPSFKHFKLEIVSRENTSLLFETDYRHVKQIIQRRMDISASCTMRIIEKSPTSR